MRRLELLPEQQVVRQDLHPVEDVVGDRDQRGRQDSTVLMTGDHSASPDLAAYQEAIALSTPDLVSELARLLGLGLVAYLGSTTEISTVRQWAQGTQALASERDIERLRLAFRAARLLVSRDCKEVAQAWFQGLNPSLGDLSPARTLREGDLAINGPRVLAAARQFATTG